MSKCSPPKDCSACDINGDLSCNILDFIVFQNVFNEFKSEPLCGSSSPPRTVAA